MDWRHSPVTTPSRRRMLGLGLVLSALALGGPAARAQDELRPRKPPRFQRNAIDQDTVTLVTVTGHYPFLVDMVFNPGTPDSALRAGPPLRPDQAILYVADPVRPISVSNRGVAFATDFLFITGDGRIVQVEAGIMPDDPTVFTSWVPVKAAMQTAAGTVRRLDIAPGDDVLNEMFGRTL
jgi:uncharacterized membrane protein (UPF0127 family)